MRIRVLGVVCCFSLVICFTLSGCGNDLHRNLENNKNGVIDGNGDFVENLKNGTLDDGNLISVVEREIASFSTPLTSGSPNRVTNIKLTCDKINGYVLKSGETFSFNQLVGPCTAEEGYLEAEIFVNKQIKYALGGRKLSG